MEYVHCVLNFHRFSLLVLDGGDSSPFLWCWCCSCCQHCPNWSRRKRSLLRSRWIGRVWRTMEMPVNGLTSVAFSFSTYIAAMTPVQRGKWSSLQNRVSGIVSYLDREWNYGKNHYDSTTRCFNLILGPNITSTIDTYSRSKLVLSSLGIMQCVILTDIVVAPWNVLQDTLQ